MRTKFSLFFRLILTGSFCIAWVSSGYAAPLDGARTLPDDLAEISGNISTHPELQTLILRNRDRALWLLSEEATQASSGLLSIANTDLTRVRFNPRRCMRVMTDTLVAARFGGESINGQTLTEHQIEELTQRAVSELRIATSQALSDPTDFWYWYRPFNESAPHVGTLEVAEVTACLSLGYDWLRGSGLVSEQELGRTRQAIIKGLTRIRDYGRLRLTAEQCEPTCKATNQCSTACWSNWNAVLNGVALYSFVAIEPDVVGADRTILFEVMRTALRALPTYMSLFSYDATEPTRNGAYPEGTTYLNFSLEYFALADVAWGRRAGRLRGFSLQGTGVGSAGDYAIDSLSPFSLLFVGNPRRGQGLSLNFGDGSSTVLPSLPVLSWLGKFHEQDGIAAAAQFLGTAQLTDTERKHDSLYTMDALAILWFTPSDVSMYTARQSRVYGNRNGDTNLAVLHREIPGKGKFFAALKGGQPAATPHGHMDSGSFLLEAFNRRWAFDLGHDSYRAPGYFSLGANTYPNRWSYLRANNHGHNTLSIGGALQNPEARTPIFVAQTNIDTETAAVADLSAAYAGKARAVRRRLAIHESGKFIVKDRVSGVRIGETIRWQMNYCLGTNPGGNGVCYSFSPDHRNPIEIDSGTPKLARIQEERECQNPRYLDAQIVHPAQAVFSTRKLVGEDIRLRDGQLYSQADNESAAKCYTLAAEFIASSIDTTIEIHLTPGRE